MADPADAFAWLPERLRGQASVRALAAGETLFRQGDPVLAIYALAEGRIRMVRHTVEEHPVVLHTARPGELFAEAALFSEAYHCDAVADLPSRLHVLPKAALLSAIETDPQLAKRFIAVLARQVVSLRARLEQRNIRSARERILRHLALSAGPDGRTVRLDGTLMDLAAEIGLTHEALYRTLSELERAGRITREPNLIRLVKPASV